MKLKGVSQFEQHVEKIVLLIVCAVFLLVLSMQFLLQPNKVKVGTGPEVTPQHAFDVVEALADRVNAQLQATDAQVPDAGAAQLEGLRQQLIGASPAPSARLALGTAVELEGSGVSQSDLGKPFMKPRIPAPSAPLVHAFASTIDPFEVRDTEYLASLVPSAQPYDKRAVTVEVAFDGTALQAAFEAENDDHRSLPSGWWRGSTVVLGLMLERQELTQGGEWTNLTLINQMPGRADLLSRVTDLDELSMATVGPIISEAAMLAPEVQRPSYYRTIAGQAWVPPSRRGAIGEREEDQAQIDRLKDTIRSIDIRLGALGKEADDDDSGGGPEALRNRGSQDRTGGRGRGQQKSQDELKIENFMERRSEAIQEIYELGFDLELGQFAEPIWNRFEFETGLSVLDDAERVLWAHDLEAESGRTYRYRITAVFNNPFFGRGAALDDDQASLAASPMLQSEPSEWSEPVEVDRETYAFFYSASEGDQLGGPRATVHLFGFYYGYWRQAVVSVEPGDTVVGEASLPELQIFDLEKLQEQKPVTNVPDRDRPGFGPGTGDPLMERARAQVLKRADEDNGNVENAATSPALSRLPLSFDAFLLDVAKVPGGGGRTLGMAKDIFQAVIRGPSGAVMARVPEFDRSSDRYARLALSAKIGERQGEAEPQAEEEIIIQTRDFGGSGEEGGGGGGG